MRNIVTTVSVLAATWLSLGATRCPAGMVSHEFGPSGGADRPRDAFVLDAPPQSLRLSVTSAPASDAAKTELFRSTLRSNRAYHHIAPDAQELAAARSIRVMPWRVERRADQTNPHAAAPSPALVALMGAAVAGVFATRPNRGSARR